MTVSEYNRRQCILQLCRIFADQMQKCMENAGLIKEGFHLNLHVGKEQYGDETEFCSVELEESINDVGSSQWEKTRMLQVKLEGKGWLIHDDPLAETGTVPVEPFTKETFDTGKMDSVEGSGKTGSKPYPPDGLCVGSRDYRADVGGGD